MLEICLLPCHLPNLAGLAGKAWLRPSWALPGPGTRRARVPQLLPGRLGIPGDGCAAISVQEGFGRSWFCWHFAVGTRSVLRALSRRTFRECADSVRKFGLAR